LTTAGPRSDDAEFLKFWAQSQPGFRFSSEEVGSARFFTEVESHRYTLEPHIPSIARFERWSGRDVLEAGCGIATDGLQFARAGARYTGLDVTKVALDLARQRFDLEGQDGRFVEGSVTALPFEDQSFDLVYSHGVIHHVPGTQRAVEEFHRVLRPGGIALVMIYHRQSLNFWFNIMVVRRMLAALLLLPRAPDLIAGMTGETSGLIRAHRELLRQHGLRYLTDRNLFLSKNTDGPGNPLSRVFSRREALHLFRAFEKVSLRTRYLNLRIYPGGQRLAGTSFARRVERRLGWHLYVEAQRSS
jgi:ubiquinone/menaquinone biosynthesis C-methylase UbiE